MKKFILLINFLLSASATHAGLLSDAQIEACKNDASCFVCLDSASNSLASCESRPTYDINLQKANPSNPAQLCSLSGQKELCSPSPANYENYSNKTFEQEISTDKNFKRKTGDFGSRQWEWVVTNNGSDISVIVHRRTKGTGGRSYSDENKSFTLISKNNESISASNIIIDGDTTNPISIGQSKTIGWDYNPEIMVKIDYTIKIILSGYNYICPSNSANICMEENGAFYCNRESCYKGSDLQISNSDNSTGEELQQGEYEWGTCNLDNANLFAGRQLSCRRGSATTPLKDCCSGKKLNEDMKKMLKYGAYGYIAINPLLAYATIFGSIMELFGEHNAVKEWLEEATTWLSGGVCEEGEISLNALKSTAPNDGNCVKLGEICSDYRGAWGTMLNQCWYTEIKCDRVAEVYCCFDDMMAKATAKAARVQLGIGWGTDEHDNIIKNANSVRPGGNPCNPDKKRYKFDCRGITISEMVSLNLNTEEYRNDIRDYADHLLSKLIDENGQPIGKLQEIINDNSIAEKLQNSLK